MAYESDIEMFFSEIHTLKGSHYSGLAKSYHVLDHYSIIVINNASSNQKTHLTNLVSEMRTVLVIQN